MLGVAAWRGRLNTCMHAKAGLATCSTTRQPCILLSYGAIGRDADTLRRQANDDEKRKFYVP